MNAQISEKGIQALFAETNEPLGAEGFTDDVLVSARKLRRRVLVRRIVIGFVLFLAGIPFEEFVLQLSQLLMTTLVAMDDSVAAQILAPVNTLGGLLSAVLLSIRLTYRKLFFR